jgi:hypothetical protein
MFDNLWHWLNQPTASATELILLCVGAWVFWNGLFFVIETSFIHLIKRKEDSP